MDSKSLAQRAHHPLKDTKDEPAVVAPCRSCYGAGVVLDIQEEVLGYAEETSATCPICKGTGVRREAH